MRGKLNWKWFGAAVCLGWLVLVPGLLGTSWRNIELYRPIGTTPSGDSSIQPLADGQSIGLKFVAPKDGLAGLEFKVATYQRINPVRLVLLIYRLGPGGELRPDPADRAPVRRAVLEAAGLKDWGSALFKFRPIDNSGGRGYLAVLMSPGANVFGCVGLIMTTAPENSQWSGFLNGSPSSEIPAATLHVAVSRQPWYLGWWWLMALVPLAVLAFAWLRNR